MTTRASNVVRLVPRETSGELKRRAKKLHEEAVAGLTQAKASRAKFHERLRAVSALEDRARELAEKEQAELEHRDEIHTGALLVLARAERRDALPTAEELEAMRRGDG